MADNVTIPVTGSGDATPSISAEEIGAVKWQRMKLGAGKAASTAMIGHLEDDAHTTGDAGVMALGVRKDTAASLCGTDGDYTAPIFDSTGRMHVNVGNTVTVGSHAVTNAGTFAVQVDGIALTRLTDIETNTDSLAVVGNGAAATALRVSLASDSTGIVALTTSTASIGKLAANSGVNIGDVDVTSVIPGTGATNLGKAIDTATGATDTGVLALATRDDALGALTPLEGDNVQLRVDANGALWVIVSGTVTVGSHAVTNAGTFAVQAACTNAGTFAVQVDGAALTALQIMDDWDNAASDGASVSGDVAHDTADAGEPVKIGAKA
ncbi:MAG: hypothetical protein L0206_16935, partial [Actinobacteria bacterium]|nr:hypothetical protein [Actinomycetota bacterium]